MNSKIRAFLYAVPLLSVSFAAHCEEKSSSCSSSSSSSTCSHSCRWGLDPTFNPCSTTPGINIAPTSPFLAIGESIAIDDCNKHCCKERYLLAGDSVNNPNYCTGTIDGHIDERSATVQAFTYNGTRDISFADNGVLSFNTNVIADEGNYVLVKCHDDGCQTVYVIGNEETTPSGDYTAGIIGNCNPNAPCGSQLSEGPNNTPQYLSTRVYLARFNCDGTVVEPESSGCYGNVPNNIGTNDLSVSYLTADTTVNPECGPGSLGFFLNYARWDTCKRHHILTVGANYFNLSSCFPANPSLIKTDADTGCNDFVLGFPGDAADISNWVDCANTANPLSFGEFDDVTTITHSGVTSYFPVGDADLDSNWPYTARCIAAKYNWDGTIDNSFGYITISGLDDGSGNPAQQILPRSIVNDGKYLYIAGDIAPAGSGLAGATSATVTTLVERINARALIIVLNLDGTPVDIDPTANHNTVLLNWSQSYNGGTCDNSGQFNAITTNFFGSESAWFGLAIDHDRLVAAGFASDGVDLDSQRPIIARYLINDSLNLDPTFNDVGYIFLKDISPFRSLARALTISDREDCHKRYLITGQVDLAATTPESQANFALGDVVQKAFFIAAFSKQEE